MGAEGKEGIVMYGKVISSQQIANELYCPARTVRHQLKKLEDGGYIAIEKSSAGQVIYVKKIHEMAQSSKTDSPYVHRRPQRENAIDRLLPISGGRRVTKQETSRLVALAMANWPNMQDKNIRIEITAVLWHKMLGHLPYAQVEAGLAKVLLTTKVFPTVAEIMEAAVSLSPKPTGLPAPDEAWDEVCRNLDPYRVPEWSHEAIRLTVQRLGGIRSLCESDNLAPARAHFFKMYEMIVVREIEKDVNQTVAALVADTKIKYIS